MYRYLTDYIEVSETLPEQLPRTSSALFHGLGGWVEVWSTYECLIIAMRSSLRQSFCLFKRDRNRFSILSRWSLYELKNKKKKQLYYVFMHWRALVTVHSQRIRLNGSTESHRVCFERKRSDSVQSARLRVSVVNVVRLHWPMNGHRVTPRLEWTFHWHLSIVH